MVNADTPRHITRGNSVNWWEQLAVGMNDKLRIVTTDWNETHHHGMILQR